MGRGVSSWGEEGSVAVEFSFRVELFCFSGFLRTELSGTFVLGWCRFLFFIRMRFIRFWGLGRGTFGVSWWVGIG